MRVCKDESVVSYTVSCTECIGAAVMRGGEGGRTVRV